MAGKKYYCLYTDELQTRLLAIAESKEQIKEETQYYSDGCWFEYNLVDDKFLVDEKILRRYKFPKEAKERPELRLEDKNHKWVT